MAITWHTCLIYNSQNGVQSFPVLIACHYKYLETIL